MEDLRNMTINDLLINPLGKGSAVGAARSAIIADLDNRFLKVMLNNNNRMEVRCFKNKDDYLIKVKVPAEKYSGLYYDVLLKFTPYSPNKEDLDVIKNDRSLNRYRLRLFSNSPNFMFTYTYVLNKYDMIVPIIKHKCSNTALTTPPAIKNPVESYGFEKSCYFACKYLKQMGYLNKLVIEQNLYRFDLVKLQTSIKSQESKMKEYNMYKEHYRSTARTTKKKKNGKTTKRK